MDENFEVSPKKEKYFPEKEKKSVEKAKTHRKVKKAGGCAEWLEGCYAEGMEDTQEASAERYAQNEWPEGCYAGGMEDTRTVGRVRDCVIRIVLIINA